MNIKNTENSYGVPAIALHWIMGIIIIGMIIIGLYMVQLPSSLAKLQLYGLHKSFGLLVLSLFFIRAIWRLINITPILSGHPLEKFAAHAAHFALYGFMVAMPISGWLFTSAAGLAPSFFGLFVLPNLCEANIKLFFIFQLIHKWSAYGLIGLITIHAGAAFKHHFIDKDNILRRMLPWSSKTTPKV